MFQDGYNRLYCEKCKHEVYGNIIKCPYCGSIPVKYNPDIIKTASVHNKYRCKSCKMRESARFAICPHCGKKNTCKDSSKSNNENSVNVFLILSSFVFVLIMILSIMSISGGCDYRRGSEPIKVKIQY